MTTTQLSAPSHRGKILAILIACALALACILPLGAQTSGIAAYAAADTKVTVTYQADENGFHVARQAVDIHPGLAAEYGYSYGSNVKASDLTALDALVAAHILIFGTDREDINGALSLYSGGFISMAFGSPDSVITFVNGAQSHTATGDATFYDSFNGVNSYTGDAVNQAVIKSGDLVEFFTIHDTDYWMDNFVWFEKGGAKAEKLAAAAGSTVELDAKGYMNWYALAVPADLAAKTEPIEDAALTEVEMDEDGGWRVGYFSDYGDPLDVSGDDGKLSIEAPDETGTYYYSVYDDSEYAPLFSPWLELDVVDQPVMDVIEMISALPKNPDKGDAAAVEAAQAAYGALTAEQKNQLPAEYRQALQEAARKVDIALRSRTVSFDAGGGKLSGGASKAVLANEPYGALPTAARAGYDFDGWYTAKSGGTKVTASTTVAASEGVTLYAHWTAKKYKTALNANGGKAAAKSVTATYGAKYPALPKAARKGYTFKGWYTARSGGAKVGADTVANTAA
ncbi:MAG: InlB B-repeat-containing protein, partial [Clostridiales Family XIII bacterium]|nr:InlB B-repeat-containing protein [Clostridiales Family XIII bacterium]